MKANTNSCLDVQYKAADLKRNQCILEATVKYLEDINTRGYLAETIDSLNAEIDDIKLRLRDRLFYAYSSGR